MSPCLAPSLARSINLGGTPTPAGRAERVRVWIRQGLFDSAEHAVRLGRTAGIGRDEVIALLEMRIADLEARSAADASARLDLLNKMARSGRY